MGELWYKVQQLPDLTLNKYASLEGSGVDGVIEKHIAFLRQLNRKGIVSVLSYHLFYFYVCPGDKSMDNPGHRLQIFIMVRGDDEAMNNVPALIEASPLSDFFCFEPQHIRENENIVPLGIKSALDEKGYEFPQFGVCSFLTKTETLLPVGMSDGDDYYMLREWEMNEDGRLYNMCKMMEALNRTSLYRVDLYPVEKSLSLRESLRKPMNILRKRQDERGLNSRRDYDGKDVLKNYEDLIEKYDSSPHFISNIMVFANTREDSASILDAAGSESLLKGKYSMATFFSTFTPLSFLKNDLGPLENLRDRMVMRPGRPGLIVCRDDTACLTLNYLPTMFSLEEIAPFFRLPALYDGEVIQLPKETAPVAVEKSGSLFLGKDKNGYDVYFPLKLLPKHAFISGVPGSGKTNTMHHITSSLWKDHHIPFLVLEPAKQEYRALINDPEMKGLYLFSPNADMSFPLHINPFEMSKGTLVAEHIRRLCSVFEGAFPLEAPMPFLLDTAIEAVYRELDWIPEHVYTGTETKKDSNLKRPLPTMSMLYRRLEQELKATQYSDEVRGNLESALKVRIGSLLRREMGDVFDVPESTFPPEKWLEVPAIIELESMGTGPANFLTLMLCSLIRETLKVDPYYHGDVRHVIFIEEAHNLIGPESEEQTGADADPKRAATAFIVKMLAEVRALKEGIVIADQLPTVMAQEVLKNTGLKIGLRITSSDDRSLLGSTMAASALQLEQMATFSIGEALIFYEKLMRPFNMRIKEWWEEVTVSEQKDQMTIPKNDIELRNALQNNSTYQEENMLSIKIIGNKYYRLFEELQIRIKPCDYWYNALLAQHNKIVKLTNYLEKVEYGEIIIDLEEKDMKYDQLDILQNSHETLTSDRSKDREPIGIIKTAMNYVFTLERLKRGRWTRFRTPEKELMKITLLQVKIAEITLELYRSAVSIVGNSPAFSRVSPDIDELIKIEKTLNDKLNHYVKEHGSDFLQLKKLK